MERGCCAEVVASTLLCHSWKVRSLRVKSACILKHDDLHVHLYFALIRICPYFWVEDMQSIQRMSPLHSDLHPVLHKAFSSRNSNLSLMPTVCNSPCTLIGTCRFIHAAQFWGSFLKGRCHQTSLDFGKGVA